MTIRRILNRVLTGALLVFSAAGASADGNITGSGFLSNYDRLEARVMNAGTDYVYIAPGTLDSLDKYQAVMIDQPEVFLSPDSEYKGVKPDTIKAIADVIRATMMDAMVEGGYQVVEQPGANVLYMRLALSDLYLKKKKRGLLGYTPVGLVVNAGSKALSKDALKGVDIIEMSLEAEFFDSDSIDTLAAIVVKRGGRKDKKMKKKEQRIDSDEFTDIVGSYAARVACRLNNAKLPESDRQNCIKM